MSEDDGRPRILVGIPCDQERQAKAGIVNFRIWPDAVKVPCEICHGECWIGPRQAAAMREHPEWPVRCVICEPPAGGSDFRHLGSDWDAFDVDLNKARENLDHKINEILLRTDAGPDFWQHFPDDTREAAELVKRKLWRHPLINDVYNRMNAHIPNTRPEHAIGHKLWAELTCATIILAPEGAGTGDDEYGCLDSGEVVPNEAAIGPLMLLRIAQTYLWTEQTERLARSAPLPKHTISKSVLPSPTMFWAREFPHGGDHEWVSNWFVVADNGDHIYVAHDALSMDGQAFRVCSFQINYGATWPDDFSPDDVDVVAGVLKQCAFLNSPYVTNEKRKIGRHIRRQMERQNLEPPEDDVSVVILRRMQVKKAQPPSGEHPGVEWKHHWWVKSFYRAQWYPSEQAHRVIWIESFLKGDLTKPLLEKIYNVKR